MSTSSVQAGLPLSTIPIFTTVQAYREWRQNAFLDQKTVGFVPTMGALHDGHLALVKRSLAANDLTVVSIFVNPAQFAPHEDLATYPRTLPNDLALLADLKHLPSPSSPPRTPSALFLPSVQEMYPSGISQEVGRQSGTFVEVKGYGEQMEGRSRPTFFRGVATVVTKLFNIIQPTNAYFGQKDIQQGLLLRRLVTDLHMAHPAPERLHIVPTARDPASGLALSSRNAYLSEAERRTAPALYAALQAAARAWDAGESKARCVRGAVDVLEAAARAGAAEGVEVKVDYVEMNDPGTFEVLGEEARREEAPVVLSAAVWVGRTRLIDNIVLGDTRGMIMG
ncbi:Pantoate-beta-alanine ligase [Artomyces pyxidatus]|uniref:Pantoate-beta-alanine ligase n=1 Tax=Artomyces pyxidatus TaxID=48021 RepID=A0ACB8SM32_9AGAM|nr:Pantoate-beta-alanine ligase [Artomyces pyxidatus]